MGLKLIVLGFLISTLCIFVNTKEEINGTFKPHVARTFRSPRRMERMVSSTPPKKRKIEPPIDLLISEVNLDSPTSIQKKFVELELVRKQTFGRPKSNLLEGYFLLFVTSNPLQIAISVNLAERRVSLDPFTNFIVIATSRVESVDYDLMSDRIHKIYKSGNDAFPNADVGPVGIIVVFQPNKNDHRDLMLFKSPQGQYLGTSLEHDARKRTLIKSLVKDMVVIGRKAPFNHCEFFDYINPVQTQPYANYILRDFEELTSKHDYSLNRCAKDKIPFKMSVFKTGKPTPGQVNDCSGTHLVLEHEILNMPEEASSLVPAVPVSGCYANFPNVPISRYQSVLDESFQSILQKHSSSPFNKCPRRENPADIPEVIRPEQETMTNQFKISHTFQEQWQSQCSSYLPRQGIVLGYSQVRHWVEVLIHPTECRFSCAACKRFFADGFRVDFKYKSDMQTDKGYFSTNPSKNQEHIISHNSNDLHIRALAYVQRLKIVTTKEEALREIQKQELMDLEIFRPTMIVMQFVYTEIMADVSFNKHPLFMKALIKLGLKVGNVQHSSRANASTFRNVPYLVVLMQTTEKTNPRVFVYCLLPLDGEKGSVMLKNLKEKILSDQQIQPGFEQFFKDRIIAQSSDSASAMVGSQNSFYTHLRDYIGRDVALIKCAAHRAQLAVKHAMNIPTGKKRDGSENKYFLTFGTLNNELYSFYYSRGSKRFLHLFELAEEMGFTPIRLKYFFDIRWAASHKAAMLAMHTDYHLIKQDLKLISVDRDFDESARGKAKSLQAKISDKTFFPALCEMLDILAIFSTMSLSFQVQDGLMLSKAQVVRQGINDVKNLKDSPGKYLTTYLSECECPNVCSKGECSLTDHDN